MKEFTLPRSLLLLMVAQLAPAANHPASRLYVSDERGGAVVVVDPASAQVVAHIAVGKRPRGLALAPDGKHLYVALSGSAIGGPGVDESALPPPDRRADGIGVVDLKTLKLVRTLRSGPDPEAFALAPDGRTLYVSNEDAGALSAVDVASGKIRGTVKVGSEPEGVAVRPDGRIVYVTCEGDASVYALDAKTLSVVQKRAVGLRPRAIAIDAGGHVGFVSNEMGKSISTFDPVAQLPRQPIALTGNDLLRPMGLALTHDGRRLYVTTGRGGSVLEIDASTARVMRTISGVGARPWGLALSADGRFAYTANGSSGDISIIDLDSGSVVTRIAVGQSPWGIVSATERRRQ
jgi:YVTN family beta-propeller protein